MDLTIIGAGSMAMALADGWKKEHNIEFAVRDSLKYKSLKDNYIVHNLDGFNISDRNIVLAIKPYGLSSLKDILQGEARVVYSVMAGVPIKSLEDNIKSKYYIRTMPNISAKFQKSTTTVTGDLDLRDEALALFKLIGDAFWLDSEREIDISTAVAGSGPALLALVAEALGDGLVKEGLRRDIATDITNSLFSGFAHLVYDAHPAIIKDRVMSPAGTTARAYYALEERGVRGAFIKAVEEAYNLLR